MMRGNQFFREIKENAWNPDIRIKEYEKFNTQVQVVCTIPVMFSYWAKAYDCLEISRFLNDHIAELIVKYPKNYLGLATIPMQDTELAIQELERVKGLGLSGVQNFPKYFFGSTGLSIATRSGRQSKPCLIRPMVGRNDPPACAKFTRKLGNLSKIPPKIIEQIAREVSAGIPTSHGNQYRCMLFCPIMFQGCTNIAMLNFSQA